MERGVTLTFEEERDRHDDDDDDDDDDDGGGGDDDKDDKDDDDTDTDTDTDDDDDMDNDDFEARFESFCDRYGCQLHDEDANEREKEKVRSLEGRVWICVEGWIRAPPEETG